MAAAWRGRAREVVVDPDARTTVGNAINALDDVRRVGAREVVVVTSRWHAPRARAAFRLVLRGSGVARHGGVPDGSPSTRVRRCGSCRCGCCCRCSSGTPESVTARCGLSGFSRTAGVRHRAAFIAVYFSST